MKNLKHIFIFLSFFSPLFFAPILLGGVYSHINHSFQIAVIVASFSFLFSGYLFFLKKRLFIPYSVIPLFFLIFVAIFQLLPIPLIHKLSFGTNYFLQIDKISLHPLTMSIPNTLYSILRILVLILFLIIIKRIIESERKKWKHIILNTIILSSTFIIFLALFLKLINAQTWLDGHFLQNSLFINMPLINNNHASAYLGFSGIIALTLAIESSLAKQRFFYGSIFFLHALALIATLSRGGILSFIFSIIVFILLYTLFSKDKKKHSVKIIFPFLFFAVFVAFYTSYHLISKEIDIATPGYFDKLKLLSTAFDYFKDFWIFGSGLGSFSHVFPFFQQNPSIHFLQLENEFVQLILETGIIFSIIFFYLYIKLIKKSLKTRKYQKGFFVALFFVLMQNSFDFNLHDFAIQFPFFIILTFLTDSIELKNKSKNVAISLILISGTLIFTAAKHQSFFDFKTNQKSKTYKTLVYLYPSDYRIPMKKALNLINSRKKTNQYYSAIYFTEAVAKAPNYYFLYFSEGTLLLKLNNINGAIKLYKQAVEKAGRNTPHLLSLIYKNLKQINKAEEMSKIIPFDKIDKKIIINLLNTVSKTNPQITLSILKNREKQFFTTTGDALLREKQYKKLEEFINKNKNNITNKKEKGHLIFYKAIIEQRRGNLKTATKLMKQASILTNNFWHWYQFANLALDNKEISTNFLKLDAILSEKSAFNKNKTVAYYKWKSKFFKTKGNLQKSIEMMEKAADFSKSPSTKFELANLYFSNGFFDDALRQYLEIKDNFPKFHPKKIKNMIKITKNKIKKAKDKLLKEHFFYKKN